MQTNQKVDFLCAQCPVQSCPVQSCPNLSSPALVCPIRSTAQMHMSTALPEPNAVVPNVPQKTTPRLSLFRTLEAVKAQVEYDFFGMKEDGTCFKPEGIYLEVCLLIAEMYIKPPEMIVRIRSSEMEAGIVQEVYSALEHHHIEHVVDRFREQTGLIHRKTSYLQTALYNVLFEFDAYYMNRVTHDLNSGKKGV